jgi:hypothetical protein
MRLRRSASWTTRGPAVDQLWTSHLDTWGSTRCACAGSTHPAVGLTLAGSNATTGATGRMQAAASRWLPPSGRPVRNWHPRGRVEAGPLQVAQVVDGRLCCVSPINRSARTTAVLGFILRGGPGGVRSRSRVRRRGGSTCLVPPASAGCRVGRYRRGMDGVTTVEVWTA